MQDENGQLDLSGVQRLLLIAAEGQEFPAARAAVADCGFAGEMRVISHAEWDVVISGKCARFIPLPVRTVPLPLRVLMMVRLLRPHRAWAEAIVWVSPRDGDRRRLIHRVASGKPVYVFHQARLRPYDPARAPEAPETQIIQQREAELAVTYLKGLLEQEYPPADALRVGLDGDAMHERMATGIQWYRRHLFGALRDVRQGLDLSVVYPTREPRTVWELPWARAIRPVPQTMRSYIATDRAKAYPIDVLTGPLDLFHMTFFDPLPFQYPRLVTTIYDLMPLVIPETYPERIIQKYQHMIPFWKNEVAHFICISEATRRDVIKYLHIEPERATTIHPGAHPHYHPRGEDEIAEVRRRYGIEGPYLLALGSVVPHKNFQTLCKAFRIVRERTAMPHKLVIVGKPGWNASAVFDEIRQGGTAETTIFAGYADFCDTPALYSGAAAFCHTSIFEGYGLPVQEALCCGCPVMVSDCTSLPEVAGPAGLASIYWDPRDVDSVVETLTAFVRDDVPREERRRAALERAHDFITWDEVARQHRAVYDGVMTHV